LISLVEIKVNSRYREIAGCFVFTYLATINYALSMLPVNYIKECQLQKKAVSAALEENGFAVLPVLPGDFLSELEQELSAAGAFNYDQHPDTELLQHAAIFLLAEQLLRIFTDENLQPVKIFVLDKTPEHNWHLPWHQDRYIAVKEKIDVGGYNNWSAPAGIPHVEPPPVVLENMLSLRIHLDRCHESNGPMWMIPGTHRRGYLSGTAIEQLFLEKQKICGTFPRGGILLFRPLLLHYSPLSQSADTRRVLQIEYADRSLLDERLKWHT
jgi:hypothetical protein